MAAASNVQQFLEDLDEKVLECPLCYNRLKDPKTLPCLHTYCLPCLTKWVSEKGKLVCPTCRQSFTIPDGGLKKLPPNTFINNLLERIEQFENADKKKCYCGKNSADFYCQECTQYICTACKHTHETLPALLHHKLHTIEDIQSMTVTQFSALRPPLCPSHKKELEFYCNVCKVPVCMHCAITDHKELGGKHEPIHISEAFKLLKQTSIELKKDVDAYKKKIQDALTKVNHKTNKLEQGREKCRKDINNFVEDMIQMITEKGEELNRNVDKVYTKKKKIADMQTSELNTIMLNVDRKWNFIAQLLKSNEATALQSSHDTIAGLQKMIQKLPETEPKDNGEMHVNFDNKYNAKSLKQKTLGFITEACSKLASPREETKAETLKHDERKHVVRSKYKSTVVENLDELIRKSVSMITVAEKQNLVNTIETPTIRPWDVVMDKDGCLLVSSMSNEIHRYKQSGEYVSKITLPSNVKVRAMYQMKKNDWTVFIDDSNKCITICKPDGHVVKTIGKRKLSNPYGIFVDENVNVVYVTDILFDCVFVFNMDNGLMIKRINVQSALDVTVTNEGHLIVAVSTSGTLKLFDNEGKFIKVLIHKGDEDGKVDYPQAVIVDKDNNILVTSSHRLQLFKSDGQFIKRIDQKDALCFPGGLSTASYYPRRVAVANRDMNNIKIFNY